MPENVDVAQGLYALQLWAQKGSCNCIACQGLRAITEKMVQNLLKGGMPGGMGSTPDNLQQILSGLVKSDQVIP